MVKEMSFTVVNNVLDSWESLKRKKNYEREAGIRLFQKLFTEVPEAKKLFGFQADMDPYCEHLIGSKGFINHAVLLIEMIETALNLLGPDIELLTETMEGLGTKHVTYGVKPEMFPIMGKSLIATLKELLDEKEFDSEKENAWNEVYNALAIDMLKAQTKKKSTFQ